jgi:hypothetical protein
LIIDNNKFISGGKSMKRKVKSIIRFMGITGIIPALLCFAGIAKAQSTPVPFDSYQEAIMLAEDLFYIMQADNDTDSTNVIQCVFSSALSSLAEVEQCFDDRVCTTAATTALIIDIIQCANEDNQDILVQTCKINTLVDMIRNISTCQNEPICVLTNMVATVVGIIDCDTDQGI